MKTGHTVSIGSCDPGMVNGSFAYHLVQLAAARSSRLGPFVRVKGSAMISKSRNRMVKQFLDSTKSDWLLMIDSDEELSVLNFDKLIYSAHDTERPIVSALVFASFGDTNSVYPKPVPVIFQDTPEGFLPLNNYDDDSVFEIDACGTGCVIIHRSVFEKMREMADPNQGTDWCWFWDGPIDGDWVGEDLLFSRRAKNLGFKIHANTGVVIPHQKSYWLNDKHHKKWQRENT